MQKSVYEFISKANNDPIVERRTCAISGQEFPIFTSEKEFLTQMSPTFVGKKFAIPHPMFCPAEREKQRTLWRNERKLYKRTCSASGKQIISQYAPTAPYKVYDQNIWRSDSRDPMDYGRDFDFSKTFTEQFAALFLAVPKQSLYNINPQNSEYCHCASNLKNCYLVTGALSDEDSLYLHYADFNMKSVDCYMTHHSELCYQCSDCVQCYKCRYSQNCKNCRESNFLYGCDNCNQCFGCTNLVGKSYCVWNEQKSKEEYLTFITSINLGSRAVVKQHMASFEEIVAKTIKPAMHGKLLQNTFGNFVDECKNCIMVFNGHNLEDCKYSFWFNNAKNCQDVMSRGSTGEMLYQCVATGSGASHNMCVSNATASTHLYYSTHCDSCHNCFACTGLRNQEYCILNKQYSKQEYEIQVAKIIEHMRGETSALGAIKTGERGHFFNPQLSPFAYNETVANELYPLTEKDALQQGYRRQAQQDMIEGTAVRSADDIKDIPDDILQQIMHCEISGRPFKLTKQELRFYRMNSIPVPTRHPDIRHQERVSHRPAKDLFLRTCSKTGEIIASVYPENTPFPVYSMKAYEQALYG